MNKIVVASGLAAALTVSTLAATATSASANPHRSKTVKDTVKIVGNLDSGAHGYWASLDIRRSVEITPNRWRKGVYKVVLTDEGTFRTLKGAKSPGAGKELGKTIRGFVNGEYAFTVTSERKPSARWVKSFYNYRCDIKGTGPRESICPGMPTGTSTWPSLYFGKDAKIEGGNWKWTYTAPCERWVNSNKGNHGDVGLGCPIHTTPKAPVIKQATCKTPGTVTARPTKGVTYKVGTVVLEPGKAHELATGRHWVTAEADAGYTFRRHTQTRWLADIKAPRWCPKPTAAPSPTVTQKPAEETTTAAE